MKRLRPSASFDRPARASLKMLQSERWSQGGPTTAQQYLLDVLAVLNEMMGSRGFVETKDPRTFGLIAPSSYRLIS